MIKIKIFKRVTLVICLLALLGSLTACGGTKAVIDPDAKMIGSEVSITENSKFKIMALMETTGSDYARPEKDNIFIIVKFLVTNDSKDAIEINEADFKANIDGQSFAPIPEKLNFVPDKMPKQVSIDAGSKYTAKLVWMISKKAASRVLVFKPSLAQNDIKFNLVQVEE